MQESGWIYHSEVVIWKDPVIEMQRTKSHGLLYKQLRKDSSYSRQGVPDYLVIFRKWAADDVDPEPVIHTKENFDLPKWQAYASPVWFDIRQTNVLNVRAARDSEDEKHICPLQLDVIERAVELWTNPGDIVFSPFAGIGSEGYVSLKMGRRFMGIELKESYWKQAIKNCEKMVDFNKIPDLFDGVKDIECVPPEPYSGQMKCHDCGSVTECKEDCGERWETCNMGNEYAESEPETAL
jgi:hypothetical protein